MDLVLSSAGEVIAVHSELDWVTDLVAEASGGGRVTSPSDPTVVVEIESSREPFAEASGDVLTRGASRSGGAVVVTDAATSGFDVRLDLAAGQPRFVFRWRPPHTTRVANTVMRSRFVLLARAVLLQYPALWAAGRRGRAPLHAAGLTVGDHGVVLAGPGGVGKTTILAGELAGGERATADNLVVSDGCEIWGLAEPLRIEGGSGRRMPHGRRETTFPDRLTSLVPDLGIVVRRGRGDHPVARRTEPEELARELVAGTYMAGELRRFWALAATWSLGLDDDPVHPPVAAVAARLAGTVMPFRLTLARERTPRPLDLIDSLLEQENPTWT